MKKTISFIFLISLFFVFFSFSHVMADISGASNPATAKNRLENPLGQDMDSPQKLIGRIINSVLGIVGSLALLMFVFGGLTWMTSSGNPEKIQKGKNIIVWAAIGLVIVFFAYGITRVLIVGIRGS
ncbi:MAG: Mbov_0395 family pilin-like conjugal transfer protein [Patescibacteria group bacterium]|jgi:hypothetical protein|nr:pilin [bacterium]HQC49573.1 pilin [bacterium]